MIFPPPFDEDEEEALGQIIYKSSQTAKSYAEAKANGTMQYRLIPEPVPSIVMPADLHKSALLETEVNFLAITDQTTKMNDSEAGAKIAQKRLEQAKQFSQTAEAFAEAKAKQTVHYRLIPETVPSIPMPAKLHKSAHLAITDQITKMNDSEADAKIAQKRLKQAKREINAEVGSDGPPKKIVRQVCSAKECTNNAIGGGICAKHGATRRSCKHEGCTNYSVKGGVCKRHGAKTTRKICIREGCKSNARKGGICLRHGAVIKTCTYEGCTNYALRGGVCTKHGAKKKTCNHEGCTSYSQKGGVCLRHGAKIKICTQEGCTNYAVKGGVCKRHGAKVKKRSDAMDAAATLLKFSAGSMVQ